MLMHTRGILIMMPESAMVLTGKQALEYSGGVAAEDNQGIGGYERIMGPNGQAQYRQIWAKRAGFFSVITIHVSRQANASARAQRMIPRSRQHTSA
jgi:hypothetical protein